MLISLELNDRYDIDGKPLKNTARYINHSCEPNCAVHKTSRTIWIVAVWDITAGEELSYNYGCSIEGYEDHPCQCGSQHCCGYILAQQYWGVINSR
jgi:SET domain-containing protein